MVKKHIPPVSDKAHGLWKSQKSRQFI